MKRRQRKQARMEWRAVSPDGVPGKWRQRRWAVARDAVYGFKGWGVKRKGADGSTFQITISAGVAYDLLPQAKAAGWTFEGRLVF